MTFHKTSVLCTRPETFKPLSRLMNELPADVWNRVCGAFGGLKTDEDKYAALLYGAALAHYDGKPDPGLLSEIDCLAPALCAASRSVDAVLRGHRSEIEASGLVALFAAWWEVVEPDMAEAAAEAAPAPWTPPRPAPVSAPEAVDPGAVAAAHFIGHGWAGIACDGKIPKGNGWQDRGGDLDFVKAHYRPGDNIGLVMGRGAGCDPVAGPLVTVFLDADFDNAEAALAARKALPNVPIRVGRPPRFGCVVRMPLADATSVDFAWSKPGQPDLELQILGRGAGKAGPKQFVAYGIHPVTEQPYEWEPDAQGRTLFDLRPDEAPIVSVEHLLAAIDAALAPLGWRRKPKSLPGGPSPACH